MKTVRKLRKMSLSIGPAVLLVTLLFGTITVWAATITESFDDWSDESYGDVSTYNHMGIGQWETYNSTCQNQNARSGNVVRFNDNSSENEYLRYLGLDGNGKDDGVGTISFWYRHWDGDASSVQFQVQYREGAAGTWQNVGSVIDVPNDTTYRQYQATVNVAGNDIFVQVISIDDEERLLIDDFEISDYGSSSGANLSITKIVTPTANVAVNDGVTYTVVISNSSTVSDTYTLFTDTLPAAVDFAYWVTQPNGTSVSNDELTWHGTVTHSQKLTFTFAVTNLVQGIPVENTAEFSATTTGSARASYIAALACDLTNATTCIHLIQGDSDSSNMQGDSVTVEGIVVGVFPDLDGFFVQEEDSDTDDNPATSEGIFVYLGSDPTVSVGDKVQVTGAVDEHYNNTQLDNDNGNLAVVAAGTDTVPTPASVTLPIADTGDWEHVEGMLINIPQELHVTENYNLGRYGQVALSINDHLYNPTNVVAPGTAASARQALNDRSRVILDDANTNQNPDPIMHPAPDGLSALNTLRGNYTVPSLTGVLDQYNDDYRVQPVGDVNFVASNPRTAAPAPVGGSLTVASFNVLNYFNGDGSGSGFPTSRGADSLSEFNRQRDKIIAAIVAMDADVVGLMEIENDGYGAHSAIQDLVNGLNASAGTGTYAFVNPGAQIGTDEIAVGLIYQPGTVTPVGTAAILDDSFDSDYNDGKNRPALAQTFAENATGEKFTAVVNHLKSKGSTCDGDPDTGDGQGNCNLTRKAAMEVEVTWLTTDPTGSGDPDFIILGDLNSYAMEDPITVVKNAGYTNLLQQFVGADAYSYVFYGQVGYLDHAMSNASLTPQVVGATAWHINADEPHVLDYNEEYQTLGQVASLYNVDPYRASDHDPVIVGLHLGNHPNLTIAKSVTPLSDVFLGAPITYTIIVANNGNAAATGVLVTDTLASGVSGSDLNWTGSVTAGAQVEFTISVVVTTSTAFYDQTITNTAYFSHTSGSGSADAAFTIESEAQASLSITKTVQTARAPVLLGDPITYTLIVANSGNAEATGVLVTDTLEPGVNGSNLNWTGSVTAGAQVEFTISAVVTTSTAFYDQIITNTAYFSHTSGSGSADAAFTIASAPPIVALSITKTVQTAHDPVLLGDLVTYTITIANSGNAEATGVIITDALPSAVTFGEYASNPGGTAILPTPSGVITWEYPVVGGSSYSFAFTATVTSDSAYSGVDVLNVANFTSDNGGSGSDEATFTIAGAAQPSYTLTVNVAGAGSVTLAPAGGIYTAGMTVSLIPVPAISWEFDEWSNDLTGRANPATITMNAHKTVTATFIEKVQPTASDMRNSLKSVNLASVSGGDQLTYTLRLLNSSTTVATANLTDSIPTGTAYVTHSVWASSGTQNFVEGQVRWSGDVVSGTPVIIQFAVTVNNDLDVGDLIENTAYLNDGAEHTLELTARSIFNPGFWLSINDGALYTNQDVVTLTYGYAAGKGIAQVQFGNDGGFGIFAGEPITPDDRVRTNWQLDTYGNLVMPRTVYARFRDPRSGLLYGPIQDDIVYDPIAPTVSAIEIITRTTAHHVMGIAAQDVVTIRVTTGDDNSGVAQIIISHDATCDAHDAKFNVTQAVQDFAWTLQNSGEVYVCAVDRAGNLSSATSKQGEIAHTIFLPLVIRNGG